MRTTAITLAAIALAVAASSQPPTAPLGDTGIGTSLYAARCAPCHGVSGKGDAPAAAFLKARPRDLTSGQFKIRSTETGSLPTDADLLRVIELGMPGSSMPSFRSMLSAEDIRAVAAYVKTFSPRFKTEQPKPVAVGAEIPPLPASIAAGMQVYTDQQCEVCHGTDGRGTDAVSSVLEDDWGRPIVATDLTEPWTFRGGATARDIYLRIKTGMNGAPMPSFADSARDSDLWHLANYIVSLARKPAWRMDAQELAEFYAALDQKAKSAPVERGRYLVESMGCAGCHSPLREDGGIVEELKYAGGQRWRLNSYGDFVTSNLTSDKATGLGGWTDEAIKRAITRGVRHDGSRLPPFPMAWPNYANMTPEDLDAMVAYLRTIPPVVNRIPDPIRPNPIVYLRDKFRMLILKEDIPSYVYPGNAGSREVLR